MLGNKNTVLILQTPLDKHRTLAGHHGLDTQQADVIRSWKCYLKQSEKMPSGKRAGNYGDKAATSCFERSHARHT